MTYGAAWRAHLRSCILRTLEAAPGYAANAALIADVVRDDGVSTTRDQVVSELEWLKDQGLVTVEDVSVVKIATITERGQDVAKGHATVTGVKRPGPKG